MNRNIALLNTARRLPAPSQSGARLVALAAPDSAIHPRVIQALARHAVHGERLGLVIGHNRFALYELARRARYYGYDPGPLLAQIELSRAFTCYQMHHRVMTLDDAYLQRWRALYVLGLLDTFYDESVPLYEAERLLHETLEHLQELSRRGLVVLITAAPSAQGGRVRLLELVAHMADDYVALTETRAYLPAPSRQMHLPGGQDHDGTNTTDLDTTDPGV